MKKLMPVATRLSWLNQTYQRAPRLLRGLALSSLLIAPMAMAQQPKIGAISPERIFRESPAALASTKRLETEFAKRDQELQSLDRAYRSLVEKIERDASITSASELDRMKREALELERDLKRKQQAFREDLGLRRNEELNKILELANKIIRQIGETEKFDLIVQDPVFVSKQIDLTDRIIKMLDN